MSLPAWLPRLCLLSDHGGDWSRYAEALYAHFKRDFLNSRPTYRGRALGLKRHPIARGKEATFWHMISDGDIEEDRLPNLRRCERICWARPLIEGSNDCDVRVWQQERKGEKRIAIAVDDFSYIVILAERGTGSNVYLLPWTTFYVDYEDKRRRYGKEWERNKIV